MTFSRIAFVVVAVVAFVIDRVTKLAVEARIDYGEHIDVVGSFLQFRHVRNRGIAFGLFSDKGALVLIGTLVVGVLLFVFLTRVHPDDKLTIFGGALVTGGALGNLYDRVEYRYVIDFIHLPRFPTFNIADICITIGVVLIILGQVRDMRREAMLERAQRPPEEPDA